MTASLGNLPDGVPQLPDSATLATMRKGARKRKVPRLSVGTSARLPGVGETKILDADGDICIEWQLVGHETRRFSFKKLSLSPELEALRLEVGWLMASIFLLHGSQVRDQIPGPNEAMRESSPYFEAEARWRHWAVAPAGHMIF